MKVLFFTSNISGRGGDILCLIPLICNLKKKGIEPLVLLKGKGTVEQKFKENNIPYVIIKSYDWLFNEKEKFNIYDKIKWCFKSIVNLAAEIRAYVLMKNEKIDILHLNCIYNACGVKAAKKLGIPVIWHIREFAETNSFTPKFINKKNAYTVMSSGDGFIAVSESIKKEFSKYLPSKRITVIYDGIDTNIFIPEKFNSKEKNKIVLSMFGAVIPLKGHSDAIKAVKILKDNGYMVELNIYGTSKTDNYNSELRKYIDDNKLSENIFFRGYTKDTAKAYRNSSIVLICSRSEAFGRTAAEAMLKSKPVIGADVTATSELLGDGKYGLLYEPGNYEQLAEKIIYVVNNNLQDKINLAYNNALSKFDADINAKQVFDLFCKINSSEKSGEK